ncbi:MAG: MarR family winged helix-turn-helix transcriptional regulator [Methanomicrobiales archaeon]
MERDEPLLKVFEQLLRMTNECYCNIFSECGLADITVKQIAYLKFIDEQGDVTFSRLAEITRNSKFTITEMINKFVRMECVYREPCDNDRRILYTRLTDKGQKIDKDEQEIQRQVIARMINSLDEHKQEHLVEILKKSQVN